MNEKNLDLLSTIINETTILYDLYISLSKLDNNKDTNEWKNIIKQIDTKKAEIDDLYNIFEGNIDQLKYTLEFIKSINKNIQTDNIFTVFEKKEFIILKRIYNEFKNSLIINNKEFKNTLNNYFYSEAQNIENATYIFIAMQSFEKELMYRTTEIYEDNKIKYILAFLNSNLDKELFENNYVIPHNFNQNTIIDSECYIDDRKKQDYKNVYGLINLGNALKILSKTNNEKTKKYLYSVIRSSYLFIDNDYLEEFLSAFKNSHIYDELLSLKKYYNEDLQNANRINTILTSETMDIVNKLFEISESVKTAYDSLISMELNGYNNTKEYQNMLDYLKTTIEEENIYYSYFDLFPEEAVSAIDYIYELINKMNIITITSEVALNNNENELILLRINKKLNKIVLNDEEYFHKYIDEEDSKICETDEDFNFIRHTMKYYDDSYNHELLRLCPIEQDENQLTFKYNLAFLTESIEQDLLNNKLHNMTKNFNDIVLNSSNIIDNNKISFINNKYALMRLALIIDDILDYDDSIIYEENTDINYENEEDFDNNLQSLFDEELDLEEIEKEEEQDEELDKFYFEILIAEFKACTLFTDQTGLQEIKERIDKKYKYYSNARTEIFNELYNIINSTEKLKKEANLDICSNKNRGQK